MKKKTKILVLIIAVLLALAAVAVGIWFFVLRRSADPETVSGNKAGVSWYDEKGTEFVINTADELYDVMTLSEFYDFKGQTIKLGADITVNEGDAASWEEQAPKRKWYPISGFAGTFDGQGHMISGLYGKGLDSPMGLFSNTQKSSVIRNLRLVNSYFMGGTSTGTGSISSNGGGTFDTIYSNAIVVGDRSNVGGIIGSINVSGEHRITNCWFDGEVRMLTATGRFGGGIVGNIAGTSGIVNIEHCLNTAAVSAEAVNTGINMGGLCGIIREGVAVNISDSLGAGKVQADYTVCVGSLIGQIQAKTTVKLASLVTTNESYGNSIGLSSGNVTGSSMEYAEKVLAGYGAYQWTTLDFEKYWAIVMDGTPVLKSFAESVPDFAGVEKAYNVEWYDENESLYTISNLEELYGFCILSADNNFAEKTIRLGADITVNKGAASDWKENAPENPWYPIKTFAGTFDGQGHTICGVYLKSGNKKIGLFSQTTGSARVKNLRLTNSYFESTMASNTDASVGSIAGVGNGKFDTIYSDAVVVSSGNGNGGLFGVASNDQGTTTITNCQFDGNVTGYRFIGGIVGSVVNGNFTIEHCLNSGSVTGTATNIGMNVGGLCGIVWENVKGINIGDSLNVGQITAHKVCTGSVIGQTQVSPKLENVYTTKESYATAIGLFNNGATADGSAVAMGEALLEGYGGYQWTTLDFDTYWAVVKDDTPTLVSFAVSVPSLAGVRRLFAIEWYDENASAYTLNTVEDLYGFYIMSSSTDFAGKTVKLGADITVNEGKASDFAANAPELIWNPIQKFAGIFDGQGHTISGLYLKTGNNKAGFFAETTNDAVVKNLKLTNSYFESTLANSMYALMGSIVGFGRGTFDTIYSDAIVVSSGMGNGGLIGVINTDATAVKISNCQFDGSVTGYRFVGGLVGCAWGGTVTIEHCLNNGSVKGTATNTGMNVGGLCGFVQNTAKGITISDSLNVGQVTAHNVCTGSVIGQTQVSLKAENVYTTTESYAKAIGLFNNGAKLDGTVTTLAQKELLGAGAEKNTALNFDDYWVAKEDATPELKSFKEIRVANISWYESAMAIYNLCLEHIRMIF